MLFSKADLIPEITFKTSRSSGKGGQNVNKVSSKVELNINISKSSLFTEDQKRLLITKLANKINSEGILQIITEENRSQLRNKEKSLDKLFMLIVSCLKTVKPRRPTKPSKASKEKRLRLKQATALKKIDRRRDRWE